MLLSSQPYHTHHASYESHGGLSHSVVESAKFNHSHHYGMDAPTGDLAAYDDPLYGDEDYQSLGMAGKDVLSSPTILQLKDLNSLTDEEYIDFVADFLRPTWTEIGFVFVFLLLMLVGIVGNLFVVYVVSRNRSMVPLFYLLMHSQCHGKGNRVTPLPTSAMPCNIGR